MGNGAGQGEGEGKKCTQENGKTKEMLMSVAPRAPERTDGRTNGRGGTAAGLPGLPQSCAGERQAA